MAGTLQVSLCVDNAAGSPVEGALLPLSPPGLQWCLAPDIKPSPARKAGPSNSAPGACSCNSALLPGARIAPAATKGVTQ